MKRIVRPASLLWCVLFLQLLGACDTSLEPKPAPYPVPDPGKVPSITLDHNKFHRFAESDSVVVFVTAEENASYDVQIPAEATSWISTSTLHGTTSGRVGFLIGENKSGQDRSAVISFCYSKNDVRNLSISQEGKTRTANYESWGLYGKVLGSKRNARPYHWYIDQSTTGPMANNNCGPSCVTMAVKWYNSTYDKDAAYARSRFRASGGWWYMSDITGFLGQQQVPYRFVVLPGTDFLKKEVDDGNIIIICLDMHPLSYSSDNNKRVDKFYSTTPEWGHFLLVYGYVQTETEIFFEVCDPNSYGKAYLDQTLKGDGRFYRGSEVYRSVSTWSSRVCVIEHP